MHYFTLFLFDLCSVIVNRTLDFSLYSLLSCTFVDPNTWFS